MVDGQADGKPPFLEAHNPTMRPITTRLSSPPSTPRFGGAAATVTISAGESIRLTIDGKTLTVK
ncbi:MAG: hypothetical protein BWY76_02808 [bacterium ADurb.Bin429]|nr:MAG: hypothetical protein BWY76_02808 [bacterium ADurb.Bin429]